MENYRNGVHVSGSLNYEDISVAKTLQDVTDNQLENAGSNVRSVGLGGSRADGALKELKTAAFCLSDDLTNHIKISISANDDMQKVLKRVEKCFGVDASTFEHIVLINDANAESSAPITTMNAFWEIYEGPYSDMKNAKFLVVFEESNDKEEEAHSFDVTICLGVDCRSLAPADAVHTITLPWDASWEDISKAVCIAYAFPLCSVDYFLVMDADGDEMSSPLNTAEKFRKAVSTFKRYRGHSIQVYLDDATAEKVRTYIQRQKFLMSSENFCIELDCDKACRAELFLAPGSSWEQISDEVVRTLGLGPKTVLKKMVLVDADHSPISAEITTDSKFWKLCQDKYRQTLGSHFDITVTEPQRQHDFFEACCRPELATTIFSMIKLGVDVNAVCEDGSISGCDSSELRSGIHLAILASNIAAVRLLCALDCLEVNRPDVYGMTPLHHACNTASLDLILVLIEKKAEFKGHNTLGKTALHAFAERGFDPCRNSGSKISKVLSNEGESKLHVNVVNAYDNSGSTALIMASKRGDLPLVTALIECGAIANMRDSIGMSAFLYAVHAGSLVVARYLLEQGSNVTARNNAGEDAFMMCAITGNLKVSEFLLGLQLDFDTRNHMGQDLREVATACGNVAIADWFASNGSCKKALSIKAINHLVETDISLELRLRAKEHSAIEAILKTQATIFDGPSAVATGIRAVAGSQPMAPPAVPSIVSKKSTSSKITTKVVTGKFSKPKKEMALTVDPVAIDSNFSVSRDGDIPSPSSSQCGDQPQYSSSSSPSSLGMESIGYDFSDLDGAAIYNICNSGNKDKMQKMFESGRVNLNAVERDGSDYTALHGACEKGNLKVVQVLLESTCNPNPFSFDGETPLYLACSHGHVGIAKLLAARGVDVTAKVRDTTVLHVAAANMHLDMVTWLVKQMKFRVDALNDAGFTALHETCRGNDSLMARLLVNLGASVEVCENSAPLHVACFMGHLDLCKWLVSKGSNPNTLYRGRNCFFIACSGAQPSVAAWLDSLGTDIHCSDMNDGRSALHAAVAAEHKVLCEWLINKSDNYLRIRDHGDESAYCLALRTMDKEIVAMLGKYLQVGIDKSVFEQLIKEESIDMLAKTVAAKDVPVSHFILQHLLNLVPVNYVCTDGCTPLHFAAAIGNVAVMNYLISKGAPVDARNRENKTPLHYAAITGSIEAGTCLSHAGADLLAKDCDGRDSDMYAKHFNHKSFVKWYKKHPDVVKARAPPMNSAAAFFSLFSCVAASTKDEGLSDDSEGKVLFEENPAF